MTGAAVEELAGIGIEDRQKYCGAERIRDQFGHGVELFHVVQCDDFDGAIAKLSELPVDQRWQTEMARYVVVDDNGPGAAVDRLRLVYRR